MPGRFAAYTERRPPSPSALIATALCLLLAPLFTGPAQSAETKGEEESSCVTCHSNPDLLVQNKKLYDYYQDWRVSVHSQEQVACEDCTKETPNWPTRTRHMGGGVSGSNANSAVNFRNIPDTCGQCHDEILDGFRKSAHFEHVVKKKQEEQGPTCVTLPRLDQRRGSERELGDGVVPRAATMRRRTTIRRTRKGKRQSSTVSSRSIASTATSHETPIQRMRTRSFRRSIRRSRLSL